MSKNKLDQISERYGGSVTGINRGTGYRNIGGDVTDWGYSKHYVNHFGKRRFDKINLLEIGVFKGHGLAMWSDYFINGNIYGVDISVVEFELMKPELENMGAFSNKNLCDVVKANSTEISQVNTAIDKYKLPNFDIIIDDGRHKPYSQADTLSNFWSKLNKNGIYVIEDINPNTADELNQRLLKFGIDGNSMTWHDVQINEHNRLLKFGINKNNKILFIRKNNDE